MGLWEIKDRTAVVGVGGTRVDRDINSDMTTRVVLAFKNALDDCGLDRDDIDGLVVGPNVSEDAGFDRFPIIAGLNNVRWQLQTHRHGRMFTAMVAQAAMAIANGDASAVACLGVTLTITTFRHRHSGAELRYEDRRPGYGAHLESPVYGGTAPHTGAALAMKRYMLKYGYTDRDLGAVSQSVRQWACLNPNAYFYDRPFTIDEYLAAPYVVEPLRAFDCGLPSNAAYCFIIASADRARDLKKPPVFIAGLQGPIYDKEIFIFGRPGLGVGLQSEFTWKAPHWPAFKMAGITVQDIDLFYEIGSFSVCIPFGLELFGFCGDGEALSWVQNGRIAPGGELGVDTNGGSASESFSAGYGHVVEATRQLRGECGPRQFPDAEYGMFGNPDGGAIVLRR